MKSSLLFIHYNKAVTNSTSKDIQRSFKPGSEWIYFKIYAGPKSADKLLSQLIGPLVNTLLDDNIIDKWFFIRYDDPDYHLRLRLHLLHENKYQFTIDLFDRLAGPFLRNGIIHKVLPDTYNPEIERYGPGTMKYSELIFFYDSEMCLQLLEVLSGDQNEKERWLAGLRVIDALLDDFNYKDQQKLELLSKLNMSFAKEFNKDSNLAKQISTKYREYKNEIEASLSGRRDNVMSKWVENIIKIRSANITQIRSSISIYLDKDSVLELDDLMGNYIHMTMNRMFRARQRTMEMVLYDFLFRTYKSKLAKKKYGNRR